MCSCFNVCWSFGVAGLGWYPCGRLKHNSSTFHTDTTPTSHTETPTHIETRTHNQCGDTTEKSQAPDDGCINVRNMLSIEEVKCNLINCDIKLVSQSSTERKQFVVTVHIAFLYAWVRASWIEFNNCPTRCNLFSSLHFCRQLYMFRVLTPIIRSWYSCNYSFWYWLTLWRLTTHIGVVPHR